MTMNRFLVLATALLVSTTLVESFSPSPRMPNVVQSFQGWQNSMLRLSTPSSADSSSDSKPDPPVTVEATPSASSSTTPKYTATTATSTKTEASPLDDIKEKVTGFMNQENFDADAILGNVMNGEFGTRGEVFVATQTFLVLCILFGGLPVIGDALFFLCGPALMLVGAGAIALGIVDMGSSLSPWPVPTGDGLITDGIYSKIRHPIYAGLLAIMAGFSVATGSAPRLLLTAALWYALDLKSNYEEAQLIKEYSKYEDYQESVPGKFFPQEIIAILPWTDSGDDS